MTFRAFPCHGHLQLNQLHTTKCIFRCRQPVLKTAIVEAAQQVLVFRCSAMPPPAPLVQSAQSSRASDEARSHADKTKAEASFPRQQNWLVASGTTRRPWLVKAPEREVA